MSARRTGRAERGSALVEFAVVTTAAFTMMFGLVDFGRALYTYHLVADAARAGGRYAIVHGASCTVSGCPASQTQIQTYVRGLAPGIDPAQLAVTTSWAAGTGCGDAAHQGSGCIVTVSVTYPFKFMVPLLPGFTMNMASQSQMVISQ